MTNFFYKNKVKLIFVVFLVVMLFTLSSCRMDATVWYSRPYTTYGNEWVLMWDEGRGFWNSLWGWPISLISYPIAWLFSIIGNACNGSFFLGLLFTTLIVRTLAWPIYSKQNGMSVKMQLLQQDPQMANIQRKYAGRTDPQAKQAMNMEMSKLYKKYKVNPLGCIGPMLFQFPLFCAMYEVVKRVNATSTISLGNGVDAIVYGKFALSDTKFHLFGAAFELNTSVFETQNIGDRIFGIIIALLFFGVTMLQQWLAQRPQKYQKKRNNVQTQQQRDQAKQTKIIMFIMNFMFIFMALSSTSLGIYWLIGAIYQILQSQIGRWLNERKLKKLSNK